MLPGNRAERFFLGLILKNLPYLDLCQMGTFFDFIDITNFALLIKNHPEIFFQLMV